MDRTLNKSYAGRVCRSMTYVSSLSHGIWGKFLSALFCKYSTLSLLTGPQPTCVQGSKILGWSSTLSIIWLWRVWLRIWGVFNPRVTYGVTLWSGVRLASLTLLWRRCPLTYYGSLSSTSPELNLLSSSRNPPTDNIQSTNITRSNLPILKQKEKTTDKKHFWHQALKRQSYSPIIAHFDLGKLLCDGISSCN